MKKLKYLLAAVIVGSALFGAAHSQTVSLNLWRLNLGSSTITPIITSLRVPCANIQGGCSGISTTTSNTFTVPQNFNGISNTGNATSTSATIASDTISGTVGTPSIIQNFNTRFNIPVNYATVGCPGSPSTKDLGACINFLYNSVSSTESSTQINLPTLAINTNYTTPINFGNAGEWADLECQPGQILQLNATSGVAITYNEGTGDPNSSYHLPHLGGTNCIFRTATSTGTTDIQIGGSNGESQLELVNFGAEYAGTGWHTEQHTYMLALYNPMARKDGQDWLSDSASDSGESIKMYGANITDPDYASSSNCIDLSSSAAASFEMFGGSVDNCQITIGAGNLGVNLYGLHMENAFPTGYPAYDFINEVSSANNGTDVAVYGTTFYQDATSTAGGLAGEYINAGSGFTCYSCSFQRNAGATTTIIAVNNTNSTSNANIQMCYTINGNAGTAFTRLIAGNTSPTNPQSGCFVSEANSWLAGWSMSNANLLQAWNGNNAEVTIDPFGHVSINSNKTGTSTFYVTGSQGGSENISSVSQTITLAFGKYQVSTNAGAVTDTLPTISTSQFAEYDFINRGTTAWSIVASTTAPDFLHLTGTNATATSYSLLPGSSTAFYNDGTYWSQLWK